MFFRSKNQNILFRRLEEQLAALTQDTASVNQKLDALNESSQNIRQLQQSSECSSQTILAHGQSLQQNMRHLETNLSQDLQKLQVDVHRHDMAIEDLLDEWAEKKSDEDSAAARLREASQTEHLLLDLFEAYQEQFWNLKHFAASKDEAWTSQIALMEQALEHYQRSCAISLINECGVSVDYDLHDIIEATDTSDPALDKKIAEIYRCGYLYKGKVRKKAQAAAYRFIKVSE